MTTRPDSASPSSAVLDARACTMQFGGLCALKEFSLQVGTGDRSERIRTYNYPQGRVTDHRINLTLYQLPAIMEGALADVIGPLQQEWQAEQLASLE